MFNRQSRQTLALAGVAAIALATGMTSGFGEESKVKKDVERIQQRLPAGPVQAPAISTPTFRPTGLLPAPTTHAQAPAREVPSPQLGSSNYRYNTQGRNVNPTGDGTIAKSYDAHQQAHGQ